MTYVYFKPKKNVFDEIHLPVIHKKVSNVQILYAITKNPIM